MASKTLKVIIEGDVKGALGEFAKLDAAAGASGDKFANVGKVIAAASVATVASVGAIGVGLFKVGESFDEQYDKIRATTGKTGEALQGLEGDFKKVLSDVPASFDDAGSAIASLNQKLGVTGEPLQHLSEQFLELSRITKTDVTQNIKDGTDAINSWGIVASQQPEFLDELFRVSQATGISFSDLSAQLASAGPVLRAAGVDWEQSAAMLGVLSKNGLDVSDVLPAMSKALATAAKAGKSAGDVISETFTAIKGAPDDVTAAGDALKVFGAKAGPKLAELIREGKLGYEDLVVAMSNGKETILQAGKDTQDFGEKWELLKNRVLVALEPIATRVFDAIGNAMDDLSPKVQQLSTWFNQNLPIAIAAVTPWVDKFVAGAKALGDFIIGTLVPALVSFGQWLVEHKPILEGIAVAIGVGLVAAFVGWATSAAAAAAATLLAIAPVVLIGAAIAGLTAGVIWLYENVDWFRTTVDTVAAFLTDVVWPAFQVGYDVLSTLVSIYLAPLRFAIENIGTVAGALKDAWTTAWDAIGTVLQAVWDNTVGPIIDKVSTGIDTIKSGLGTIGDIAGGVGGAVSSVGSFLGFDEGGLVPGPVGAPMLATVHGGEYVLTADQVADIRGGSAMSFGSAGNAAPNITNVYVTATPGTDKVGLARELMELLEHGNRNGVRPGASTVAAFSGA